MTRRAPLGTALASGLVSGFVVLGIGGRVVMRIVAYTTPEPEKLTLGGSVEVVAAGAAWGALTAPVLFLLQGSAAMSRRWRGPVFGVLVLAMAILVLLSGFASGERVVAPHALFVSSALLFPAVFLTHGATAVWLASRWAPKSPTILDRSRER